MSARGSRRSPRSWARARQAARTCRRCRTKRSSSQATGTIFLGGPPLVQAATGEDRHAPKSWAAPTFTRASPASPIISPSNDEHALGARARDRRATPTRRRTTRGRDDATRGRRSTIRARRSTASFRRDPRIGYDVREVIARIVDGSRVSRVQGALRHDARLRVRAHRRPSGRHPREQRHPVQRERAQRRALHRAVRAARHAARLPAEHHRLHGRQGLRASRHREGRREIRDGRRLRGGAEVHGRDRRQLRRRQLRHVRAARIRRGSSGCGRTRASR